MPRLPNILAASACLFAAAWAAPAAAQSANSHDMALTASVESSCTVATTDMAFGVLDTTVPRVDTTATITVTCASTTVFKIQIDNGDNASGSQRRMANGSGDFINYQVYRNNNRTQVWGLAPTSARNGIIVKGGSADYTAYGRLTGITPTTPTGEYSDMLTVWVEF